MIRALIVILLAMLAAVLAWDWMRERMPNPPVTLGPPVIARQPVCPACGRHQHALCRDLLNPVAVVPEEEGA